MRTGKAGPRWGARSLGRGAGKFTARVCKPGLGVGGQPGVPCVQPSRLESPSPSPRASPPAWRGAPERRAPRLTQRSCQGSPCAFWNRLPASMGARGGGRRETSPTCLLASLRSPLPAGCACARGCECVCACVCARRVGGRGPPSVSSCLRPEMPPPPAVAGGSQVAAWPRRSQSPLSLRLPSAPERDNSPRRRRLREPERERSRGASAWPCAGVQRGGAERTAPRAPAPGAAAAPDSGDAAAAASASRLTPARHPDPCALPARYRAGTFPIPW